MNTCPCCGFGKLHRPYHPGSYDICPQCGVEFGLEAVEDYPAIKAAWEAAGKPIWSEDTRADKADWESIWDAGITQEVKGISK